MLSTMPHLERGAGRRRLEYSLDLLMCLMYDLEVLQVVPASGEMPPIFRDRVKKGDEMR